MGGWGDGALQPRQTWTSIGKDTLKYALVHREYFLERL